jgi:exodeoxyribonuclease V alpha subunit
MAELLDELAAEFAVGAPEPLATFNLAGVLSSADVRVALALARLAGLQLDRETDARVQETDARGQRSGDVAGNVAQVTLALALAVRAPRLGHVFIDLETAAATATSELEDVNLTALPWPDPVPWLAAIAAASSLVTVGEEGRPASPLRLIGSRLYLDRYWRAERRLATRLLAFDGAPVQGVELQRLAELLAALFPAEGDALQRTAAACAALRGLTVVAGGPGTGKTTTVARTVALLASLTAPPPLIALCAPTGKAAARLQEALRATAEGLVITPAARTAMLGLRASTIHSLLGARGNGRFRHSASNPLPHDIVIVDETSMVSLSLMSRLLDALRSDARIVLVGDPDQLSAIEAGAVLRDIVGPAAQGHHFTRAMQALLTRAGAAPDSEPAAESGFGDGIVVLRRGHRYGSGIAEFAQAIRRGNPDAAVEAARASPDEVTWLDLEVDPRNPPPLLRTLSLDAYRRVSAAARLGDGAGALAALSSFRILCAHRRGAFGVSAWSDQVQRWLTEAGEQLEPGSGSYVGRPLLVTANDHELRLFNGDTGVLIATEDGVTACFERDGELVSIAPSRLADIDTVYAMTIHKSQGSQFEIASVLLPDPTSRLLSRELLYTAATRAQRQLLVVGSEESLRAAIERPVARATALRERLWRDQT